MFNSNYMCILNRKETIGHQNYSNLDLTFQSYPRSKVTVPKERPLYELLFMFNSNYSSILNSKGAIKHLNFSDLDLTSQGHPRSKVVMSKERPHMNCYSCSIVTMGLS